MVKDIRLGSSSSSPSEFVEIGGRIDLLDRGREPFQAGQPVVILKDGQLVAVNPDGTERGLGPAESGNASGESE